DQHGCDWFEGALKPRLASLGRDIHSLLEYEEQLSRKVQFVLDALVGLISIAQNDIFKVLTIVSIVGIPPTLVAGIYGMNFKNMPEYDWAWGYQYGRAVIILSALIPLVGSRSKAGSRRPIGEQRAGRQRRECLLQVSHRGVVGSPLQHRFRHGVAPVP